MGYGVLCGLFVAASPESSRVWSGSINEPPVAAIKALDIKWRAGGLMIIGKGLA